MGINVELSIPLINVYLATCFERSPLIVILFVRKSLFNKKVNILAFSSEYLSKEALCMAVFPVILCPVMLTT